MPQPEHRPVRSVIIFVLSELVESTPEGKKRAALALHLQHDCRIMPMLICRIRWEINNFQRNLNPTASHLQPHQPGASDSWHSIIPNLVGRPKVSAPHACLFRSDQSLFITGGQMEGGVGAALDKRCTSLMHGSRPDSERIGPNRSSHFVHGFGFPQQRPSSLLLHRFNFLVRRPESDSAGFLSLVSRDSNNCAGWYE